MMRFGSVPTLVGYDLSEKDLPFGRDLSASTLEDAVAEAIRLPFPEGANLIKVIDRDRGGLVVHRVWKSLNG
jgi:hypothetical protein